MAAKNKILSGLLQENLANHSTDITDSISLLPDSKLQIKQ